MHAESLSDDGIKHSEVLQVVILHGAQGSISLTEVLDLFIVKCFSVSNMLVR